MPKKMKISDVLLFENWDELLWLHFDIVNSIDAMKELLIYTEKSWQQSKENLSKEIKLFETSLSFEERANNPYEFEERLLAEIKSRAFFAVFLSSYAILEGSLGKICKFIESEFEFKIKMADLSSRNYFEHYKNYLVKVYELNYSDRFKTECKLELCNLKSFVLIIMAQELVR